MSRGQFFKRGIQIHYSTFENQNQQFCFLSIKFVTEVESCEKATFKDEAGKTRNGYHVILNDTILFPEGGGQVSDENFIAKRSILIYLIFSLVIMVQ